MDLLIDIVNLLRLFFKTIYEKNSNDYSFGFIMV